MRVGGASTSLRATPAMMHWKRMCRWMGAHWRRLLACQWRVNVSKGDAGDDALEKNVQMDGGALEATACVSVVC